MANAEAPSAATATETHPAMSEERREVRSVAVAQVTADAMAEAASSFVTVTYAMLIRESNASSDGGKCGDCVCDNDGFATVTEAATVVASAIAATTTATKVAEEQLAAATTSVAVDVAAKRARSQTSLVELSPDAGCTHVRLFLPLPAGGFWDKELEVQTSE